MAVEANAPSMTDFTLPKIEQKLACLRSSSPTQACAVSGIETLLGDPDGVELFHEFLTTKFSSGHLLDFWFACKGFRTNVDPNNPDKLFQVAKVIYRTYIKSGSTHIMPLPSSIKVDIVDRMSSYHRGYKKCGPYPAPLPTRIDRTLFDNAQNTVKCILEHKFYPEFLNCLRTNQFTSNNSNHQPSLFGAPDNQISTPETLAKGQVTLHQSTFRTLNAPESSSPQTTTAHLSAVRRSSVHQPFPPLLTTSWSTTSIQSPRPMSSAAAVMRNNRTMTDNTTLEEAVEFFGSIPSDNGINRNCLSHSTPPQQSAPLKRSDIVDWDSSLALRRNSRDQEKMLEDPSAANNVEVSASITTDQQAQSDNRPPTFRSIAKDFGPRESGDTNVNCTRPGENLAETDPSSFVSVLTSRLEKVQESRKKMEKLLSWVHQVDEKSSAPTVQQSDAMDCFTSMRPDPPSHCSLLDKQSALVEADTLAARQSLSPRTTTATRHPFPESRKQFERLHMIEDDAQGILDDHCSRIWSDDREQQQQERLFSTSQYQPPPHQDKSNLMVQSCMSPDTCFTRTVKHHQQQVQPTSKLYHNTQRKRNIPRTAANRAMLQRSDAQSTASWDSGVVDHYALPELQHQMLPPRYAMGVMQMDVETKSIVAAASLQALSSSTTELAVVNSEVTAKLVERMTRHYQQQQQQQQYQQRRTPSLPVYSDPSREASRQQRMYAQTPNYQMFHPPVTAPHLLGQHQRRISDAGCNQENYMTTQDASHHHPPPPTNSCVCGQVGCLSTGQMATSTTNASSYPLPEWQQTPDAVHCARKPFPNASDTSSTFDSGISSTYDQLPLGSTTHSIDRGTRSQSLRSWQTNKRRQPLSHTPRPPSSFRTPSAPNDPHHSHHNHETPPSAWQPNLSHSHPTDPMAPCCTMVRSCRDPMTHSVSDCAYNNEWDTLQDPHRSSTASQNGGSGGKLLQHWLQLQTSTVHGSTGPSAKDSCGGASTRKQSHRRTGPSTRHGRRQTTTTSTGYDVHPAEHSPSLQRHTVESTRIANDCGSFDALAPSLLSSGEPQKHHISSLTPNDSITGSSGLIVGYYLCDDPVPYRTVWTGPTVMQPGSAITTATTSDLSLTLGQFKQLIAKRGVYRYFFKKPSDEFGTGVVHEELTHDDAILPLWECKVVARIERAD